MEFDWFTRGETARIPIHEPAVWLPRAYQPAAPASVRHGSPRRVLAAVTTGQAAARGRIWHLTADRRPEVIAAWSSSTG
jgi:hypothetical protein